MTSDSTHALSTARPSCCEVCDRSPYCGVDCGSCEVECDCGECAECVSNHALAQLFEEPTHRVTEDK